MKVAYEAYPGLNGSLATSHEVVIRIATMPRALPDVPPRAPYPSTAAYLVAAEADDAAPSVGEFFFRALVRHLAAATGAHHALLSRLLPDGRVRTFAYASHDQLIENVEYALAGTPCAEVIGGAFSHHLSGVQHKFPTTASGIEAYLGTPLKARDGTVLGHLCVFDEAALPAEPRRLFNFQIYAARAATELERLRSVLSAADVGASAPVETATRDAEAHARFRDLFEEAPIGYMFTDLESRYVGVNRTAMRILGLTQADIDGALNGIELVADTPAMKQMLEAAAEAANSGIEHSGIWEMRRKNDGQQVFVQLWTRPETNGDYIRTTFIDITERVRLEQEQARLEAQNVYLREELKSVHNFEEIVGANSGLMEILQSVRRVAETNASVLIFGETGTGKELIARAIHDASPRADKPFIKINCAALPASLVESELFGHERGAFTGAIQRRIGRFELANHGTIFLDEIGELSLDVQVRLLRVLQEREFERIGGSQTIKTDVRVIAATNRDLPAAMREGNFRADLYYRLSVFPITMPPLRARRDDIPLLAQFFVTKHAPRIGRRIDAIAGETMLRLCDYDWPGNIRELENVIERALILSSASVLAIEPEVIGMTASAAKQMNHNNVALNAQTDTPTTAARTPDEHFDLASVSRDHILNTLRVTNWVIEGDNGAAMRLGLKPATMRHRMKKLGISRSADP